MHDAKKPAEAEKSTTPTPEPNKGGFGAFAELYRARWAANHPNMRRRESAETTDSAPATPPPSDQSENKHRRKDGTRLVRPED